MSTSDNVGNHPGPTARRLLFNLLLAANHEVLSAGEAIQACALFGLSANNARVALARLAAEGLIETVGRGEYRLGPAGQALGGDVVRWRESDRVTRPWDGGWVAISLAGLARADRTALRRRERALALVGLRELAPGLFLRPDNFAAGIAGTRERLYALGLETDAPVFIARGFDAAREQRARGLWDTAALARAYRDGEQRLQRSLARLARLSPDEAAREAFLLGDAAVRQLVFDPMLPDPLVSEALRGRFARVVRHYDAVGADVWRRFIEGGSRPKG